eukprot:sb/3477899/
MLLVNSSDATELLVSVTNYENPALPYDNQVPPETRKYSIQYWISQCLFRYGTGDDKIIEPAAVAHGWSQCYVISVMSVARDVLKVEQGARDKTMLNAVADRPNL